MNDKKITYWKWKSTIIDFDNIKDEKADFGDYLTKKQMIFHYLGCPDDDIHEWYNGGWSCEYNYALGYAKEYGLVEDYIDYEDKFYNLQTRWNSLREWISHEWYENGNDIPLDEILDKMNELEKSNDNE